jgi:hypothetical protein
MNMIVAAALTALVSFDATWAHAVERTRIDVSDLLKDLPPPKEETTLPDEAIRFQKWWWGEATPQDRVSMCAANAHRLFDKMLSSSGSPTDWAAAEKYNRLSESGKIHLRKANPSWSLREVFALITAQEEKIKTFARPVRMEINYLCGHGGRVDQ